MAILPDLVRSPKTDHFADRLADLHLDIFTLADYPHIGAAQLAQQVQRRLWLLAQG
jgi:hypothetical protein